MSDYDETSYHPFRLATLADLAKRFTLNTIRKKNILEVYGYASGPVDITWGPEGDTVPVDRMVDLAVLLEPVSWPRLVGHIMKPAFREDQFDYEMQTHCEMMTSMFSKLDVTHWKSYYERLCLLASESDDNIKLYVLLRLSSWSQRERLKGRLGGALWIRHIAEVIRRGFERFRGVQWHEEDNALGMWYESGRKITYGSPRPFDDPLRAQPYVAHEFGLLRGSAVRWYLEGDSEYAAVAELVPDRDRYGIELVNLRGEIAGDRSNAALKLRSLLKEDKRLKRFSMISFDGDVPNNIKIIRRLIEEDLVVGTVNCHSPDFEFANFSIEELQAAAARIADSQCEKGDDVLKANWSHIRKAKDLADAYSELTHGTLKGAAWGTELARLANSAPHKPGTNELRLIVQQVATAEQMRLYHYDMMLNLRMIDARSFSSIERPHKHPLQPEIV